ncbi:MAG: lysoplasmalogenase [Rhizobiaceae bacterium]
MSHYIFIAAIVAGLVYGSKFLWTPQGLPRAILKTIPVSLLAISTLVDAQPYGLVAALALSAAGDWFLAFRGERNFLLGLVSFLLAHLAYAALFFQAQDLAWTAGMPFFAATVVLLAISLAIFRRLREHLGPMKIPVAIYTGAIAAMAISALGRGLDPVLLPGVLLFMASDTVLAHELFVLDEDSPVRRYTAPFVWFAYFIGQALITAAFLY